MASLQALRIATQGLFPLSPLALAVQGLLGPYEDDDDPPAPPPAVAGVSRNVIGVPFRWVPFHPVAPRRPRKKRQAEIILL